MVTLTETYYSSDTFVVPPDVSLIHVACYGGRGGGGSADSDLYSTIASGANGGRAEGDISVTAGDEIHIGFVGGGNGPSVDMYQTGTATLYIYGGNGGNASWVAKNSTNWADRLLVGAGGGGGAVSASTSEYHVGDAGSGGAGGANPSNGGSAEVVNTVNGGSAEGSSDSSGGNGDDYWSDEDPDGDGGVDYYVAGAAGGGGAGDTGGGGGNADRDAANSPEVLASGGGGGGNYVDYTVSNSESTTGTSSSDKVVISYQIRGTILRDINNTLQTYNGLLMTQ